MKTRPIARRLRSFAAIRTWRRRSAAVASLCTLLCTAALADETRNWDLAAGVGVASIPQYSGASASHPRLRLWVDGEYRTADFGSLALDSGSLTIDPELRWNVIDGPELGFGPLLGYRFGRTDKNPGFTSGADGSSRLQGLPNVASSVDAGVQGHVLAFGIPVFAQLRTALSGSQGTLLNLGLYVPLLPESTFGFTVLPALTWADARQMRALYGVSEQASLASGFPTYVPGSGWENAALELVGEWRLSKSAHLLGSFAFERLLGDAAASPIVQKKEQLGVLGGVTLSF